LYHSSALLLPDGSVLVAGSNPNVDYNASTTYPTEYRAEHFHPWYFGVSRPQPSGIPSNLTYGGDYFNITVPSSSYNGTANDAAVNSTVVLIRPGFTTHAMNMGQRYLELATNYSVDSSGEITLHVSQVPPNANLLQPGPVLLFVVVNGVPSNGTMVTVGTGKMGVQPIFAASVLPPNTNAPVSAGGSGGKGSGSGSGSPTSKIKTSTLIAIGAGGGVVLVVLGGIILICMRRSKSRAFVEKRDAANLGIAGGAPAYRSDIPLQEYNNFASDVSRGAQNEHFVALPPQKPYDSARPSSDTRYSGKEGGYGYAYHDSDGHDSDVYLPRSGGDNAGEYYPYAKKNPNTFNDEYYDSPPPQQDSRFMRPNRSPP
jgi:hypothetical protein